LTRLDEFRAYTAQNVQNWYRWVNTPPGRITRGESLYLITGADKTSSWSVAFYRDAHQRSSLTLSRSVDGASDYAYVWEGPAARGGMRTGPKRGQQGPAESRRNQCVFVRGFRLDVNEAVHLAFAVASPSSSETPMVKASGIGTSSERETSVPLSSLAAISNRTEEKQGLVNEVMFTPVNLALFRLRFCWRSHITHLASSTSTC
jgi:hypothetical protein